MTLWRAFWCARRRDISHLAVAE